MARKRETLLETVRRLSEEAAAAAAAAETDDAPVDPWDLLSLDPDVSAAAWERYLKQP